MSDHSEHESDTAGLRSDRWILGGALAIAIGFSLFYLSSISTIAAGGVRQWSVQWVPRLGVEFGFRLDGLGLLFSLLISLIGVIIVSYTHQYMAGHRDRSRLQILLVLFMLSMLGLVGADNVLVLFVFWELTTITSFLLVGFDHEDSNARRCALQALIVTGLGGLALLVALVMLAEAAGSYSLGDIIAAGDVVRADPHYGVILALVLLAAFTKSAQFPFHFWLPNAMAAPTPVSAYLHSATMVKAGIYLLARLQPTLDDTTAWMVTLMSVGAITAVWSSMMALRQSDLKLMLAWTTIMALGTITLFLGVDTKEMARAAFVFLIVHALYKCALFLAVGNVDHGAGSRDIRELGGLGRAMPITALIALGAGFSMAGFPPFLGFIGKELMYKGALTLSQAPVLIAAATLAANAMMVSVALVLSWRLFLRGPERAPNEHPHEASVLMWSGPLVLAALGLLIGIFPEAASHALFEPAISDVLREQTELKLSLWHGVNLPLIMSLVTFTIGIVLYAFRDAVAAGLNRLVSAIGVNGDESYDAGMRQADRVARRVTARIQTGSLSHYLTVVFAVFVVATLGSFFANGMPIDIVEVAPVDFVSCLVVLIMAVSAIVTAFSTSRLLSICALGAVGIGFALLFLMYSAIDVAITQLMVETLNVVLITLVIQQLPGFPGDDHPGRGGRWRDGVIAVGAGVSVMLITLGVGGLPLDLELSQYFMQNSYAEAYGANVVNVILVDFRALDTFGEVAVVVTAALAVFGLLKVKPKHPGPDTDASRAETDNMKWTDHR